MNKHHSVGQEADMGLKRSKASASPKPRDTNPGMAVRGEGSNPCLSNHTNIFMNASDFLEIATLTFLGGCLVFDGWRNWNLG